MKKITIIAALLGSVYFSSAQVGIGTSTPANSSQLEIAANDKGILIPRVELTNTTTFAPIVGDQAESLLVYNTIDRNNVTAGYYYWADNQWNRVINQADLDDAAGYKEGDVIYTDVNGGMIFQYYDENGTWQNIDFSDLVTANETKTFFREVDAANGNKSYLYFSEQAIIDWLAADSSNTVANIPDSSASFSIDATEDMVFNFENILSQTTEYNGNTVTIEQIIQEIASQVDGNVIYKNLGDTTNPDWVFQYWDGTQYQTIILGDLVTDAESKTTIVTDSGKQFYISETYLAANNGIAPTTVDENNIPAGIYLIDVVGGVVNNFDEIINNEVTVNGITYDTVEEYIEYISQNATQDGVTKIVLDGSGQASFQMWDDTTDTWTPVNNGAFETIVTENESDTSIIKNTTGNASTGDVEITYAYFNEADPNTSSGTPQATMDVNADILNLIEGNTDIQNAITNILNEGGNVYYGDHDNDGNTSDIFYTIINGTNTPVNISEVVVNAITNATDAQKQEIKNELGDTYSTSAIENTGNKWIDGNFIYTGVFAATVTGGTANVTTITLTPPTGETTSKILSIKIINSTTGQLINVATTDVTVTGNDLDFKIGTGNMYQVLGPNDIDIHLVVDFTTSTP